MAEPENYPSPYQYDPLFDTATFYKCNGYNYGNVFKNMNGEKKCISPLHTMYDQYSIIKLGPKVTTIEAILATHLCRFEFTTGFALNGFEKNIERCKIVRNDPTTAQLTRSLLLTNGPDQFYISYCRPRPASLDLQVANHLCKIYALGEILPSKIFKVSPKICKVPTPLIKTNIKDRCFSGRYYLPTNEFKIRARDCKRMEGFMIPPIGMEFCREVHRFGINQDFDQSGIKKITCRFFNPIEPPGPAEHQSLPIKLFDKVKFIRVLTKFSRCQLKQGFRIDNNRGICRIIPTDTAAVSVVYGRLNGGKPDTDIIVRSSGRMKVRIVR